jgi:membrane-associated phospholipid phosphatase
MRSRPTVVAFAVAALLQIAAFLAVRWFFVDTVTGQRLDTSAFAGHHVGHDVLDRPMTAVLQAVDVPTMIIAAAVIVVIALRRRKLWHALLVVPLLAASNSTVELLKVYGHRPTIGVPSAFGDGFNTLPSGHAAAVASVGMALLLVVPPRLRSWTAFGGAAATAFISWATVAAGWHHPSDGAAACLVVGAWTAAFAAVLEFFRPSAPSRRSLPLLALVAAPLLVVAAVAMVVVAHHRRMHGLAYAGSSAGVTAAVCLSYFALLECFRGARGELTPARGR